MKHLGTKYLQTQRLILRKFKISDAEDMFKNWANDSEVTKYLTWKKYDCIDDVLEIISSWIKSYYDNNFYLWAIQIKDTKEVIGSISVVRQDENINMCNIGYCIGKKFWKKGITTEALKKIIEFLFEEVGVNKVEAVCNVENIASSKVIEKSGMKLDGILRQSAIDNSGIYDAKYYSILKYEYFLKDN